MLDLASFICSLILEHRSKLLRKRADSIEVLYWDPTQADVFQVCSVEAAPIISMACNDSSSVTPTASDKSGRGRSGSYTFHSLPTVKAIVTPLVISV